jgi:hypothetical protein
MSRAVLKMSKIVKKLNKISLISNRNQNNILKCK